MQFELLICASHMNHGAVESAKELIRKMLCVDPLKCFMAEQASAHPWLMGEASSSSSCSEDLPQQGLSCSGHLEAREDSSSVSFMARDQFIGFGLGPHVISELQSHPFTCKSSVTAFLVEPSTPTLISAGFSFCSNGRSSSVQLASVIPSMPCFTFCSSSLGPKEVSRAASFSGSMASTSATYTGKQWTSYVIYIG